MAVHVLPEHAETRHTDSLQVNLVSATEKDLTEKAVPVSTSHMFVCEACEASYMQYLLATDRYVASRSSKIEELKDFCRHPW